MREMIIAENEDIAILEDGELVDFRKNTEAGIPVPGEIYMCRITSCLPGNPSACFLDLGGGVTGFCSDKKELMQGEFGLFQVEVSPRGSKQTRLSRNVRIIAPHIVAKLNMTAERVSVSSKIKSKEFKNILYKFGEELLEKNTSISGIIFRTRNQTDSLFDATNRSIAEAACLNMIFERLLKEPKNPGRVYKFTNAEAVLTTYPIFDSIVTESLDVYERVLKKSSITRYAPRSNNGFSLFDKKDITGMLAKYMGNKVHLKSGANIVIDKTEALTVIDVNTGKAVGKDAEIARVNLEAIREIMRQLRLKNIGGAIVCDMIGTTEENRREMVELAEKLALKDTVKVKIHGFTELGLLEISRKRT